MCRSAGVYRGMRTHQCAHHAHTQKVNAHTQKVDAHSRCAHVRIITTALEVTEPDSACLLADFDKFGSSKKGTSLRHVAIFCVPSEICGALSLPARRQIYAAPRCLIEASVKYRDVVARTDAKLP